MKSFRKTIRYDCALPDLGALSATTDIEPKKKEDTNTLGDGSEGNEGSVSNEGYRVCGFVLEEIQE